MQKYDRLIIEKIINEYNNGTLVKDIAKKYDVSTNIIYYHLKKVNTTYRRQIIDESIMKKALKDYKDNNLTATECSQKYNMGRTTLFRGINENNIDKNIIKVQHEYNKNIFEEINTEEKAYWLGFIYADGSVSEERKSLEISLKAEDEQHLIKFIKFINGDIGMLSHKQNSAVKNGKKFDVVRVSITSQKIYQDLYKWGVHPRKSQILCFPDFLPNELAKDFIRGYFDGDGCLTCSMNEYGTMMYEASIISTKSFCIRVMDILENLSITRTKLTDRHNEMFIWRKKGRNQLTIFLNYIYKDATVYLNRKYNKYLEFCRLE